MYDQNDSKSKITTKMREFKVHKLDDFLSKSQPLGDNPKNQLQIFEKTLKNESKTKNLITKTQFISNANILIRVNSETNIIHVFLIKDYYFAKTL